MSTKPTPKRKPRPAEKIIAGLTEAIQFTQERSAPFTPTSDAEKVAALEAAVDRLSKELGRRASEDAHAAVAGWRVQTLPNGQIVGSMAGADSMAGAEKPIQEQRSILATIIDDARKNGEILRHAVLKLADIRDRLRTASPATEDATGPGVPSCGMLHDLDSVITGQGWRLNELHVILDELDTLV